MTTKAFKLPLIILIFSFFSNNIVAQTTYSYIIDGYWSNMNNWTCTIGGIISLNCPPPNPLPVGDTIEINAFCIMDPNLTYTNRGFLRINEDHYLTLEEIATFNNEGTVLIKSNAIWEALTGRHNLRMNSIVRMEENSSYTVDEFGSISIQSDASVFVNGELTVQPMARLILNPGANLIIGATGGVIIL